MPDSIVFDFGGCSPADIERVAAEIRNQGFARSTADSEAIQAANDIGRGFIQFLKSVFEHLGLLHGSISAANPFAPVQADDRYGTSPDDLMKSAWNNRAHDWGVIESPTNYLITMQTLMEFMHISGKPETILSLGSGPGFYETYLAYLLQLNRNSMIRLVALDYAKEMTRRHREVLDAMFLADPRNGQIRKIKGVEPVTGNMTNLNFPNGSVDQIICNNSLQWVTNWKGAISEMARVVNPRGLGWLYLFVHTHPMAVYDAEGQPVFSFGDIQIPDLLDALEAKRFSVYNMRQIAGSPGTGQAGLQTNRVFIQARFIAYDPIRSWRDAKISSRLSVVK